MSELLGDNEPIIAHHGLACGSDSLLAVLGEGDVGDTSVAAVEGPFCLAVADDEDTRGRHCGKCDECCLFDGRERERDAVK